MNEKSLLEALSASLLLNDSVIFAYLFGSFAKGKQTSSSDVDLVVLNSVKNIYLLEDILKNGIILKDDEKRVDFELLKEHEILDYKAFKR